jgi:hypothetical protein
MKVRDVGPNCLRVHFNVMDPDEVNTFIAAIGSMLPSDLVPDLQVLSQQLQQEQRLRPLIEFRKKHPAFMRTREQS